MQGNTETLQATKQEMQNGGPPLADSGVAGEEQALPANLTHSESLTVVQDDRALALPVAEDFSNVIEIHNGRAMHSYELAGIECGCELLNRARAINSSSYPHAGRNNSRQLRSTRSL